MDYSILYYEFFLAGFLLLIVCFGYRQEIMNSSIWDTWDYFWMSIYIFLALLIPFLVF